MNAPSDTPNDSTRCEHRNAKGARCRLPALDAETTFCRNHARQHEADLSFVLTAGLDQLNSPEAVNNFLSRLLLLVARDRIAPRRAAVMAYITNQLLRTIAAMEHRAATSKPESRLNVIWDLPCPPRELLDDAQP